MAGDSLHDPFRALIPSWALCYHHNRMAPPKKSRKQTVGPAVPPRRTHARHAPKTHDGRPSPELVILTGMSGSGKASALKAFEDLGYYCVDNLPVELIPRFPDLAVPSTEIRRTALVVDVREGARLGGLAHI